ncbi:MAG: flagellar hook-basal body complex protein [Alphaproteobacteria bacterium]|jgi:flagellar basal-body rod protein FlgF|nr:flagellar hook-basal body complex protein [Alphaproteobacteria bacterium]
MDNSSYTMLTRMSGLRRELQTVAHNIANAATTGFRKEGVVFSEYVVALGRDTPSLSMALGNTRQTVQLQGGLSQTNGQFDFAIEGDGFFQLETAQGPRLTRAGIFTPNAAGELVNPDGHRLLDLGGAPIFVPPDAREVTLARDGTLSADGVPVGQVGLFEPADPVTMSRAAGTLFAVDGAVIPVEQPQILQGFLEESNVDPLTEMSRMIEVQRAYERGQRLLEREDERIKGVIQALGR